MHMYNLDNTAMPFISQTGIKSVKSPFHTDFSGPKYYSPILYSPGYDSSDCIWKTFRIQVHCMTSHPPSPTALPQTKNMIMFGLYDS